jgi:two-component system, OmpR family, phosphate regulon response regulator PhoB
MTTRATDDVRATPRRPVVLVVDDHADTREMYVEFLGVSGMTAIGARTCAEALQHARAGVHALVLDRQLPDGDGADVCRALKSDPATRSIAVIVLSGRASDGSIAADAYLVKPVVPEALVEALERLLAS